MRIAYGTLGSLHLALSTDSIGSACNFSVVSKSLGTLGQITHLEDFWIENKKNTTPAAKRFLKSAFPQMLMQFLFRELKKQKEIKQ